MSVLAFGIEPSNRKYRLRLARYRYLGEAVGRSLPDGRSRILDAGCGKGRLGLYWGRLAPPGKRAELVGMDLSSHRMGLARSRGYSVLLRGNLLHPWPFPDASFDAVVCEQVLEHFDDAQVRFLLSEVARVLRPGGAAHLGVPMFSRVALWLAPFWKRLNPLLRRLTGKTRETHLQHFSLEEILGRVRAQGFRVEGVTGFRICSLPFHLFENHEWYYRLQGRLGARFPGLCVEVGITARKDPVEGP